MPTHPSPHPQGQGERHTVHERAVAIAQTALRILLPLRDARRHLLGTCGAICQHISNLRTHRGASTPGSHGIAAPAQSAEPDLHEFVVLIHRPGEHTQERTVWARRSLDVVLDVMDELQREGGTRSCIQVKPLGVPQRHPQ